MVYKIKGQTARIVKCAVQLCNPKWKVCIKISYRQEVFHRACLTIKRGFLIQTKCDTNCKILYNLMQSFLKITNEYCKNMPLNGKCFEEKYMLIHMTTHCLHHNCIIQGANLMKAKAGKVFKLRQKCMKHYSQW